MPTTTITVNGDVEIHDGVGGSFAATNGTVYYTQIDEGVASADGNTTSVFGKPGVSSSSGVFNLGNMPSDFGSGNTITVKINAANTSTKGDYITLGPTKVIGSNFASITSESTSQNLTTTFTTYNISLNIIGQNTKTNWDGAMLVLSFGAGTVGSGIISAADVEIVYTASAGGGGAPTTSKVHKMLLGDK